MLQPLYNDDCSEIKYTEVCGEFRDKMDPVALVPFVAETLWWNNDPNPKISISMRTVLISRKQ